MYMSLRLSTMYVYFLKPSVSDPHTNKSQRVSAVLTSAHSICTHTKIIHPLYSHPAGLSNSNQTHFFLPERGRRYEVLNPGSSNTLLPNKVIIVQIFIHNKTTRRLYILVVCTSHDLLNITLYGNGIGGGMVGGSGQ